MRFRRSLAYGLLSLLLVLAQQMGISHGLTHRPGDERALQVQSYQQERPQASDSIVSDQDCVHCLAFAQIATALDTRFHSFPADRHPAPVILVARALPDCSRTVCVFQSRAPPLSA
jgi:hypothetical protein